MKRTEYNFHGRPIGTLRDMSSCRKSPSKKWGPAIVLAAVLLIGGGLLYGGFELYVSVRDYVSTHWTGGTGGTEPGAPVSAEAGSPPEFQAGGRAVDVAGATELRKQYEKLYALYRNREHVKARDLAREILSKNPADESLAQKTSVILGRANLSLYKGETATANLKTEKVRRGDTLWRVANRVGTSVEALALINNMQATGKLLAGQTLKYYDGKWKIVLNPQRKRLYLLESGRLFKEYPMSESRDFAAKSGRMSVYEKYVNTGSGPLQGNHWLEVRLEGTGTESVPQGYEIHGMNLTPRAHQRMKRAGYFRLNNRDVDEVYMIVPRGTAAELQDVPGVE